MPSSGGAPTNVLPGLSPPLAATKHSPEALDAGHNLADSQISSHGNLTWELSGAWRRQRYRSYLISIHRFPPTINEDEAARPLQRKVRLTPHRSCDVLDNAGDLAP
jgi:hypothetical protein